jgi:cell division protein FtsW (lipid II flippase)
VWLLAQALINIGAVVGLVPVIGIPLPLVSYGGSAMIPTVVALGMLLGFARAEPGALTELRSRRRSWWRPSATARVGSRPER